MKIYLFALRVLLEVYPNLKHWTRPMPCLAKFKVKKKYIYSYTYRLLFFFLREIKNPFFKDFDNACLKHLAILEGAAAAANEMTTHKEADDEVKALKERYVKVIRINPFHQA